jgi:hypothetical protein
MTNPGDTMAGRADETGPARLAGLMLVACGVASVVLLAGHPGDAGPPVLAAVLKREAAQALPDAVVHGGFVLVLVLELVGFAALAVRAGPWRTPVIAAMVFMLAGAGLLSASMIADGLVTPGIAARYATAPADKQEPARALLVLLGSTIRVLMPAGLAFLGASALAWSAALIPAAGRARIGGWVGLACAAVVGLATWLSLQSADMMGLMFALLGSAAWAVTAGVLLATWRPRPA